jgi:hypothetical protein
MFFSKVLQGVLRGAVDFLNRAEFWEYHAELWPAVLRCYKSPDPAQTKYGDWLKPLFFFSSFFFQG